ncbi:MAG: T9SS type A sorting domain-containing protein [Endomicrobia bacterium]|nr:T9SS type A sorting domain-containing protein [Endomicrobiia bacterium]
MKLNLFIFFLQSKNKFYKIFTLIFSLLIFNLYLYSENKELDNVYVNYTYFLHNDIIKDESLIVFTNFPNPFSGYTYIYIKLPFIEDCSLRIYDLFGQVVKEFFLTGNYEYLVLWDGTNEASRKVSKGGYICVLNYKNKNLIRKIGCIR